MRTVARAHQGGKSWSARNSGARPGKDTPMRRVSSSPQWIGRIWTPTLGDLVVVLRRIWRRPCGRWGRCDALALKEAARFFVAKLRVYLDLRSGRCRSLGSGARSPLLFWIVSVHAFGQGIAWRRGLEFPHRCRERTRRSFPAVALDANIRKGPLRLTVSGPISSPSWKATPHLFSTSFQQGSAHRSILTGEAGRTKRFSRSCRSGPVVRHG